MPLTKHKSGVTSFLGFTVHFPSLRSGKRLLCSAVSVNATRLNTKKWRVMKEYTANMKTKYFLNMEDVIMDLIKVILLGVVGASFCLADISGIVTDTGTMPLPGVVIKLEQGGQTATTGADGLFTLAIGSTGSNPATDKVLPNRLCARLTGNVMIVTILERSEIEVSVFNLVGKSLLTISKTYGVGTHSLLLPNRRPGIYLYKVKSGNSEFVLKGNFISEVPSGNPLTPKGSSLNHLAKQAKTTAVNNDVLAVTKTGLLNYRCIIGNFDTSGIIIKMIANAGDITDADGNIYQTVKIGNQVWTVENLRVTKYNDGSPITLDTSAVSWANDSAGKYCYYNNINDVDSIKKWGMLYNWYALNTGKLTPAGWHVPTDTEWTIMENFLVLHGYNYDGTTDTSVYNKLGKSLSAKTDWDTSTDSGGIGTDLTLNNSSGFSALPVGYRNKDGSFYYLSRGVFYWTSSDYGGEFTYTRDLAYSMDRLFRSAPIHKNCGYSIRMLQNN
jgi:uncharacterized protein (TIGR02145 family)